MLKGFKKGFGFGIGWLVGQALVVLSLDEALKYLKTRVNKEEEAEETKDKEEPDKAEE